MVKRLKAFLVLGILVALALQWPATATPVIGDPFYPDLITRPPSALHLQTGKGAAGRRLFFSNTIGNIGDGPLELRAVNNATTGTTDAYQEVYTPNGPPSHKHSTSMTLVSTNYAGTFVFHPAHNHWHFEDFARYQLRSINPDGSTGPVIATTEKVSFCMIDTTTIDSTLPYFGMGLSHSCGQTARQGVKVGMGDTYSASLPDQYIDITSIPDGTYRLLTIADPNTLARPGGRLIELNDHNNAASVDIVVTRSAVTIVPGSERTGIDSPDPLT
jgi:hypothetical protein